MFTPLYDLKPKLYVPEDRDLDAPRCTGYRIFIDDQDHLRVEVSEGREAEKEGKKDIICIHWLILISPGFAFVSSKGPCVHTLSHHILYI